MDAASRLWQVDNQKYTTLIETERAGTTLEPIYNGVGDRVGQTTSVTTTYFALDVQGLPEVIYTTEGNLYLHLPGVMMAENGTGEVRYLLSDGLGSVRQATDESGEVVAYNEFDPYGNPVQNDSSPYGFTGEWWENEVGLLHLRARWYAPETGTFLSVDPIESEPPYQYVRGNPVNLTDPRGESWQSPTFLEGSIIHGIVEADYLLCAETAGRRADNEVYIDAASKAKTKLEWGFTLAERVPRPDAGDLNPGRADIIDYTLRSVYEIKHYKSRVIGFADAVWYRNRLDEDPLFQQFAPWRVGGPEGYPGVIQLGNWPTDPDVWLWAGYTMPGSSLIGAQRNLSEFWNGAGGV